MEGSQQASSQNQLRLLTVPLASVGSRSEPRSPSRRSFPRKRVSPGELPNGGRRSPRVFPKNPDLSQSPERAEGASHPRPPELLRKGPKLSERPSCWTAGGGRSAMLDALLVESGLSASCPRRVRPPPWGRVVTETGSRWCWPAGRLLLPAAAAAAAAAGVCDRPRLPPPPPPSLPPAPRSRRLPGSAPIPPPRCPRPLHPGAPGPALGGLVASLCHEFTAETGSEIRLSGCSRNRTRHRSGGGGGGGSGTGTASSPGGGGGGGGGSGGGGSGPSSPEHQGPPDPGAPTGGCGPSGDSPAGSHCPAREGAAPPAHAPGLAGAFGVPRQQHCGAPRDPLHYCEN
ncbi:hypothetical protein J1605_000921 [Eschrichtius robustus]|uniref:Uncharacterized protein n=1 Tax=Eschrichtius robustus TaxID=9764 RepID=A0AB34GNY7_ESCRO|nr:hypothetical protein J1605_000921 [Eschrichtius robustus]